MLIPKFLLGSARDVRLNVGRVTTRLKRGESLQGICDSSEMIEFDACQRSYIWLDNVWVSRPAEESDFRAVQLTNSIFDAPKISFEKSNEIRANSVEYLSESAWGTIVLNSGQGGAWLYNLPYRPFRPCRQAFVALLKGTMRYWDVMTSLGPRYYRGGSEPNIFVEALPAYGHVMAVLGTDPRDGSSRLKPLHESCDQALIDRLAGDDPFWHALVKKWQSDAGTPELVPENIDEIQRLCERGSWDATQWDFLRVQLGEKAIEDAITKLRQSGDVKNLMGVYVHALRDMESAVRLFAQYAALVPDIHWAEALIADYAQSKR